MDTDIQSTYHVRTQRGCCVMTEAEIGVMAFTRQRRPSIVGSHQKVRGKDGYSTRDFRGKDSPVDTLILDFCLQNY